MEALFFLVILILSVIIHEIAHGYVAEMWGDPTARLAGRLTLNPIKHIDPLGSVILPALMYFGSSGNFMFGWAKPVPYNPYNLKNLKWGTVAVGLAGVLSNLFIAIIFGLMVRFADVLSIAPGSPFYTILISIVLVNVLLAVFNLIPFPPLDGAKVLFAFLPYRFQYIHDYLEQNWLLFIIFILFFAQYIISPAVSLVFGLIVGM